MSSSLAVLTLTAASATFSAGRLLTPDLATMRVQMTPPAPGLPTSRRGLKRRALLAGFASWYGKVLDGHTTASGEIFHKDALTACHPTLPFGTLVRVINLRNRRSVVVRITDRGVLFPNRVIDLSSAAATRIGMLRAGVAPVRLEVLAPAHG